MNFKLVLLICFLFSSCGLKGRPKAPAGTQLPSVIDSYKVNYSTTDKEQKNTNKKENNQKE